MNDYTFGEYLYQKRKQSGDSQNELVEKLGVTGKAVSKWENGSAKPRASRPQILSTYASRTPQKFRHNWQKIFSQNQAQKDSESTF